MIKFRVDAQGTGVIWFEGYEGNQERRAGAYRGISCCVRLSNTCCVYSGEVMQRLKYIMVVVGCIWMGTSCQTSRISGIVGTPIPGEIENFPDWVHELMADTLKVDMPDASSTSRHPMIWEPGNLRAPMPVLDPGDWKYFYHLKIYQPKNNDGWYSPDYRGDFYRRYEESTDTIPRVL